MAFEKLRKLLITQQTRNFNLGEAAEKNDLAGVKKWLAEGAKCVPSSDWRDDSPLHKAIEHGNAEMVKALLEAGASPNATSRYGSTSPFIDAVRKGNADVCRAMLDAKADVNTTASGGNSAYSFAVAANNKPVMQMLEAAGAKLDTANNDGWSPLFYAVRNNDVATTERLLKAGVRTDRFDGEGRSVLDVARAYDRPAAYNAVQAFLDAKVPEWQVTGEKEVTHIQMRRPQGYKLTDIFNFETKERTLITHNYETGRDNVERGKFLETDAPAQQAASLLKPAKPLVQGA
jgi:ankyrin repeat protein